MGVKAKGVPVMGIVNVTPASFYDGGRYFDAERAGAPERSWKAARTSSTWAASQRSRRDEISVRRSTGCGHRVRGRGAGRSGIGRYLSAAVAASAERGHHHQRYRALGLDPEMAPLAARSGSTVVLMHMKGTPRTMQDNPVYGDVVAEVAAFLEERADFAIRSGVARERIIIDPGIGFGKTLEHNYTILRNLERFARSGFPVLIGLSRKSLIGKLYTVESDRLPATIALNAIAAFGGADIIRVHDVPRTPPRHGGG